MSDNFLRYVPADPNFQPTEEAAGRAVEVLRAIVPGAKFVVARFTDSVKFVDAGSNWEGVSCPACGGDAEPWWGEAMSEAAERQFEFMAVRAGCCGVLVSLNELRYRWPVGFSRFVLEAANPNSTGLSASEVQQLQESLSCVVRQIWVRV